MRISFLGQGFDPTSPNSVGNKIIEFLSMNQFDSFLAISAFASPAGVKGLSAHLNQAGPHFRNLSIIVGIDQNGTSVEALEEIVNLGISSHIFYQKEAPIFHPKIYLFEGRRQTKLILGSSNLTANGLFSNHEASLLAEFDSTDTDGNRLLDEIKTYYSTLFDFSDPNLFEITRANIDSFITDGVIDREPVRVQQNRKIRQSATRSINVPNRSTPPIPPEFRRPRRSSSATRTSIVQTTPDGDETIYDRGNLIWSRSGMPGSSVQIAGTGNTNPTGGLRLVQGGFMVSGSVIDQTTYFRNTLFGSFTWNRVSSSPPVETTHVEFIVTVRGDSWGKYELEIRHKPSGEAGQGNYTTSISWGVISDRIRDANLVGSQIEIYSPRNPNEPFQIEFT